MSVHKQPHTSNRVGTMALICGSLFICGLSTSSAAVWESNPSWHPVFSLGAGVSSARVAVAQLFPIANPITDEFYYYSGVPKNQSSGMLDILLNAEWNLNQGWMIQGGLDYNRTEPFKVNGSVLQGADAQSADAFPYRYQVSTNQVLFNAKLLYTVNDRFHPYWLGGVGAAFNKAYDFNVGVPATLTFSRQYGDQSNAVFSYALGAGVDTDLTANMRLGIGYRYTDLGKAQLGDAFIDTAAVAGTLAQPHFYANQFLVQLTWLFS